MNVKNKTNIDENISVCIEATVKWYNPERGYGFLRRNAGSADIMIHFSHLDEVGCTYIQEGDSLICDIGLGEHGLQVIRVKEVKLGSLEPRSLATFLNSRVASFDPESLEEIKGIIKWYNPKKRYGFIYPDNGRNEIFFHASVMWAAGYKSLRTGTRVLVQVSTSEQGQEAQGLQVLCEGKEDKRLYNHSFE